MKSSPNLFDELRARFAAHREWLLIDEAGRSFALGRDELELADERGRVLLSFPDDAGFQTWRVTALAAERGGGLRLDLTRNFARARRRVRLVPRARSGALADSVGLARLEKAHRLAALVAADDRRVRLRRVALNKENGRLAQIEFEDARRRTIALVADVSDGLPAEAVLAAAVRRLDRLARRKSNPAAEIWIAAEKKRAAAVRRLHALLAAGWRERIAVREIVRPDADAAGAVLRAAPPLAFGALWGGKAAAAPPPPSPAAGEASEAARAVIALAPEAIDAVRARNGETLRYHGLPFARVRAALGRARLWFGVDGARQLLTAETADEFAALVDNLRALRRADSPNRRHRFYAAAPEAWLEALLRRDVRRLDANLVVAPLHEQFRAGRERVDLLALRRDGRLVIVELKTAPDREMVYQAADYWRRIERRRRRGELAAARLFGGLAIADAPAVCYLVAPTLAFHRDFDFYARTLAPEIEFHRFSLAENWRARPKVLERRARARDGKN